VRPSATRRAAPAQRQEVERVDIEGKIGRPGPNPRLDPRRHSTSAKRAAGVSIEDPHAGVPRGNRADPDLGMDRATPISPSRTRAGRH
jgi:hypothetical protein